MRSKDGVITFMAIGALTGERIKKLAPRWKYARGLAVYSS